MRELHERLERIAKHVPGVLYQFCLRPDGTSSFPYASAGLRDVYGMDPELVRDDATPVFNVLHPDDLARVSATIQESARTLTTWRDEYRACLPDGRTVWLEGESSPSVLADGSILWHGYIRDITARKAAEAEREEQQRIEALASELAANFVGVSPDPAAVGAAIEAAMARVAEAVGMDVCAAWESPMDRPEQVVLIHSHRRDGGETPPQGLDAAVAFPWALAQVRTLRRTLILDDTTALPPEAATDMAGYRARGAGMAILVPFFGPDGTLLGVLACGTHRPGAPSPTTVARAELFAHLVFDLLARTRSDRALARSLQERAELQAQFLQAQKLEAIGRLAGGVAHDFNNMLGAIIGYAELALEKVPTDEAVRADLEEILAAANRSKGVTRQLLAFARKEVVTARVVDLNATVAGMLKVLQRLIGEQIRLEWLPGEIGWPVQLDPAQVDQVLANLCVNARDAIDEVGTITVSTGQVTVAESDVGRHPEASPGDYAVLTVQDSGHGMTAETLERIFEPFFTTKPTGQGTGLGLPTVYGIVTQAGGFVTVESTPGVGATFRVHIPRYLGAEGVERTDATAEPIRGHGETILVVEDERAILAMVARVLESAGYHVLAASTPETALTIVRTHAGVIDLLVSDIMMPGMNGRALVRAVRAIRPGLGCIFMSGYAADVGLLEADESPACGYLQKPFTRQELTATVREALDGG